MRFITFKSALLTTGLAASVLLAASGTAQAQQTVALTAGPTTTTLPDGTAVPMWGYTCGTVTNGSSGAAATCVAANPNAGTAWSPVVITVPTNQPLTIQLTNNLSFIPTGSTAANGIPTSLMIVGQLGGGLGQVSSSCNPATSNPGATPQPTGGTCVPSPSHADLPVTWPTAIPLGPSNPKFVPPAQGPRVQSFGTEVAPGTTASLTWNNLRPGTYLIESGTHPSIQGPMGLYGVLVVTTPPATGTPGTAYPAVGTNPAVTYDAEVPIVLSEIDPLQNAAVSTAVNTAGFSETMVWSGLVGGCGNPSSATYHQCYPPAINYTPLYYLMNGVAFNRTASALSLFPTAPATIGTPTSNVLGTTTLSTTGNVLVRLVNAGLRLHLPSIVGAQVTVPNGPLTATSTAVAQGSPAGFALVAEDGNPVPGLPRVQSDVFMAAGKTYDVMINPIPASTNPVALPIYDRQLSLSGNATDRDAGMLAYIGMNGAITPPAAAAAGTASNGAIANSEFGAPSVGPITYNAVVPGQTLTVSDPSKGVLSVATNIYGVQLIGSGTTTNGTFTLNANGTFTYAATAKFSGSDTFTYCGNGTVTGSLCSTVTLAASSLANDTITVLPTSFTSPIAGYIAVKPPGVLAGATSKDGLPLTVQGAANGVTIAGATGVPSTAITGTPISGTGGMQVVLDANGGFTAYFPGATAGTTAPTSGTYTFTFTAQNSLGQAAAAPTTVAVTFQAPSNVAVNVVDGSNGAAITDYRWVIEEDRTFYINPNCLTTPTGNSYGATPPVGGNPPCMASGGAVPTLGVNFHTSHMPFVAQGCTGTLSCESGQSVGGVAAVCDVGNGVCRTAASANQAVLPSQVHLDPTKRYYISVLPGDAANPFWYGYTGAPNCTVAGATSTSPGTITPNTTCGHGMGGAPIGIDPNTGIQATSVKVLAQPSPYPPAKLSVMVFEDDFPLNGEQDGGGGVDVLSPQEPGLGGFQIHLWDAMGGNGDFTGQMTYDMFNQPLTNSLDGMMDPATGQNACPITQQGLAGNGGTTGMIVTCPKYEADGTTLSPLSGQAVVANLMPGRWGVIATPGADRIARGEEWLQTNTLDGQKAHDSFTRIGEPAYFQEFGPASFHVTIGFANPAIINARHVGVCGNTDPNLPAPSGGWSCNNTITGKVTGEHLSRTPDERLFETTTHDAYAWTQCYVSFGDPDGEDFAFTKCDQNGNFKLTGLPPGNWRVTVFDQWNDQLVDGLSTPVGIGASASGTTVNMGDIAGTQWETNMQTRTFVDVSKDGIFQANEPGIPFANVAVRLRDGSLENLLGADFTGAANFNETFPLFSWYVVETDVTRYKSTGTHVVYDVGGPVDGSLSSTGCGSGPLSATGYPPCGNSVIARYLANTTEVWSVPNNLRVPGTIYCADADCSTHSGASGIFSTAPASDPPSVCTVNTDSSISCTTTLSSGRIDSPFLGNTEGWQGFPGQFSFLEFGKTPYSANETGGIIGHVIYASTRPFDDPQMLVQTQWTPLVPNVTINLYQEGVATDGVTPTLTLVDTTTTSSFDDWAQGFHKDATGASIPNMNCPGQGTNDLFFFTLTNQPEYLDYYNNVLHGTINDPTDGTGTNSTTPLPYSAQYKCYDGMHNWNQVQPTPYDGMYAFPSMLAVDPTTGKWAKGGAGIGGYQTNCKICTANPDTTDPWRNGTPMLPAGKYVVEVVLPQGFELVKEEDKNILIGDNFIAPVNQQFGGLGNVFIMPDQASVASAYTSSGVGLNAYNAQNSTQSLGASPQTGLVPGFTPEPVWPCVGELRTVPDYISLYPQTKQVAPFAGASRHLCDRKEVTLNPQMHAIAKFYVYTSTHIASKFTGGITDDYTSEFDPFSPQFGEKFAPPQLPVSVKDWASNETNRIYADNWGAYNGMTYSTWEVNPPNPTGYSPTMMVMCMNDPGPITDTRVGSATLGTKITDPLYSQGYSQFCYELPFMPGTTQYLDTPVVPTSAFAGAGYNNVDCAYPDATPAIASVVNAAAETNASGTLAAGSGPWVSAGGIGHSLTITALGDQLVPNNLYSGPGFTTAPYNTKTIKRHYGFGPAGTVTIGGVAATVTSWSDTKLTVTVPATLPNCSMQQQAQYITVGGTAVKVPAAQCGELVITNTANGKQSIDAITVTVGGKVPTLLTSSTASTPTTTGAIQHAIDAAQPGDMIIVPAGAYSEMILMWKPVRLQGVGAATAIINANTQPAGKLDPWRRQVNCLFGLTMNGVPATGTIATSDSCSAAGAMGWTDFVATADSPQVDRLALEATVGWDATLNGNLAQLLQEPTLMGALEGAAITVLSKGVQFPTGSNPYASDTFPTGTTLLTSSNCGSGAPGSKSFKPNPYPSSFSCNPSRIDGLGLTDSSQGGGAIFVHAWGHNLEISNNRIANNAGTLSGGINIGQGEFPPAYIAGGTTNADPGSCATTDRRGNVSFAGVGIPANAVMPYCHNLNVFMHNNYVSLNSSTGDELFSSTPAGSGGVNICTGADNYKFNYNWVCGNLSSGDGGGFGHTGLSYNGDIEHNTFLFNQSLNPTIPANGGAIVIMGAPDIDPTCGTVTDTDCLAIGASDGVGANLVINANLIMGNGAEAGTGGGISFQNVNGSDVGAFPTQPANWWHITLTNNIIADNVAGWDGGGVSLLDALNIDIVNNTIINNVSTATAGVLFNTIGAPLASQTGPTCTANCGTTSAPQVAGLVSVQNSAALLSAVTAAGITCPPNHYAPGTSAASGSCLQYSYPALYNNVLWNNATYYIGVGSLSAQYQQNVISLYNSFTGTPTANQTVTGQCVAGASYWDLGFRGDTNPTTPVSLGGKTFRLSPQYSIISTGGYAGNNLSSDPQMTLSYCDGSRQPPEACPAGVGGCGWQVPPGISDATVPNPVFNLTPVATVDEGNNWVNLRWGPLSTVSPPTAANPAGVTLANYAPVAGSPAIDAVPRNTVAYNVAPSSDFYGNPRPDSPGSKIDIGAVEFQAPQVALLAVTPASLTFASQLVGTTGASQALTLTNSGAAAATGIAVSFTGPFALGAGGRGTCGATLAGGATCTINVVFTPTATGAATGTVVITAGVAVTGSPVALTGTGAAPFSAATLTPTSWTVSQARNCPGTGNAGRLACSLDPVQTFTLTNTGNITLTGITAGTLGATPAANAANYAIVGGTGACGRRGNTTLTPGSTCTITVQFQPLTAQAAGAKTATISVTDSAGTQSSALDGTAN